ncbi:gamma-glutamyl-gamma-aminobutyrate hydrolase family protein [Lactococcus insecticola]|uniref:Putative glutamine amidotransferase-like protein YvdE n=1 Tax=Pseudolactococcus insecticola TaxID=2709158 RepID=A0A6A0B7H7_9LACT|nr:gamma-glutamyl-gamma-aminobutyrate hydrolase family protein [Lactococcus insecticola]GFH40613.1 putative glutamine amidotransferase-like protein YvdE [Lactococcus insecticola]
MTTIGIIGTQYLNFEEQPFHENQVIYTRKAFTDALQTTGATVIIIPIDALDKIPDYVSMVDKILLTGGEDVAPQFYGEDPHRLLGLINPDRDAFEIAVIKESIKQKKAVFGVCRGMQLMNVALGGSLYQDLSLASTTVKHLQAPTKQQFPTHFVAVDQTSSLNFLPERYHVNSYHHQAIHRLSDELSSIATASDGIIEAVENKNNRLLAVQWHPEGTWDTIDSEFAIFKYFVDVL